MSQEAIRKAILAIKNGQIETARTLLIPVIKSQPTNEQAWLVFIATFESDQEKIDILQRFLKINPSSFNGANLLVQLKDRVEAAQTPPPPPPAQLPTNNQPTENEFSSLVDDLARSEDSAPLSIDSSESMPSSSDTPQEDDFFAGLDDSADLDQLFTDSPSSPNETNQNPFADRGDTSDLPTFFAGDGTGILDELSEAPRPNQTESLDDPSEDIFNVLEDMSAEDEFDMPELDFEKLVKDATGELNLDDFENQNELQTDSFDLNMAFLNEEEETSSDESSQTPSSASELPEQNPLDFDEINLESALLGYTDDTDELFKDEEVPASLSSIVEEPPQTEEPNQPGAVFLDYDGDALLDQVFDDEQDESISDQQEPIPAEEPQDTTPNIREELGQEEEPKRGRKKKKKRSATDKKKNKKIRRRVFAMIWAVGLIGIYQFLYLPGKLDPYIDPVMQNYVTPFYQANLKPIVDERILPLLPFDLATEETTPNQGVDLPAMTTATPVITQPINLAEISGDINVRMDDTQDWRTLNNVQSVIVNGQIQTDLGATVRLDFDEQTSLLMQEETTLTIVENQEDQIILSLLSGEVYLKTSDTPIQIQSTVANLQTQNSTALFLIDDSLNYAEVNCFEGDCAVSNDTSKTNIKSGMAYLRTASQTNGTIQPIQAPALRTWIRLDPSQFDTLADYPNPILGGTVWNDVSQDGLQNPDETAYPNLPINLINAQGDIIAQTQSDANGHYLFNQPETSGNYYLSAAIPNMLYPSPIGAQNVIDPQTNETPLLNLGTQNNNLLSLNIGLMPTQIAPQTTSQNPPSLPTLVFHYETQATGLINNTVTRLFPHPDGSLWAATPRGLSVYTAGDWQNYRISDGLANETIYDITTDGTGNTYVISQGNALSIFDGSNWSTLLLPDSIQFDNTTTAAGTPRLAKATNGHIWMAFNDTLYQFDGTEWTSYADVENVLIKDITDIAVTPQNTIWLAHWGGGVSRFDGTTWTYFTTQDGLLSQNVSAITLDANNQPLIATTAGLMRYQNDLWTPVYQSSIENLGTITALAIETIPDGNQTIETLWVGTQQGAYHLQEQEIIPEATSETEPTQEQPTPATILETLPDLNITDITFDANDILWFATNNGAIRRQGGQFINYPNASSPNVRNFVDMDRKNDNELVLFTQNQVYDVNTQGVWVENSLSAITSPIKQIAVDGLDRTWVMTDDAIVTISNTFSNALDYPEIWFETNATYHEMIITPKNTTWIATDQYVASQSGFGWLVYDRNSGIPSAPITDFYVDDTITVVVTDGGGASILENGNWRFLHQGNGLTTNALSSVTVDSAGNIWFGTYQAGLIRYDGTNFTTFTTEDGLLNYQITDLAVGENDVIWVGTILGLNAIVDDQIFAYTTQDGLPANSISAILPMADGSVWLTTTSNTLTHFIP